MRTDFVLAQVGVALGVLGVLDSRRKFSRAVGKGEIWYRAECLEQAKQGKDSTQTKQYRQDNECREEMKHGSVSQKPASRKGDGYNRKVWAGGQLQLPPFTDGCHPCWTTDGAFLGPRIPRALLPSGCQACFWRMVSHKASGLTGGWWGLP